MTVKQAIEKRRAYRILEPAAITEPMMTVMAGAARLAPSCYNHQPWRYIFVKNREILEEVFTALPEGNAWARQASLVVAVFAKKGDDCVIKEREYYLFDTGMATAAMILQATELDLVAHPIAGYAPEKVKKILAIPEEYLLVTLLIIGKKAAQKTGEYSREQLEVEEKRPRRRELSQIYSLDRFRPELQK